MVRALSFVVREPDAPHALAICPNAAAAVRRASRIFATFCSAEASILRLVVEAHDFEAVCEGDLRFPIATVREIA